MAIDPAKLDSILKKEYEENEKVRELVTNARKAFKEVEVLGVKIKIKPTLNRQMRRLIQSIQNKGNVDVEEAEGAVSKIIASMCIEYPFNTPEFWDELDEEYGIGPDTLASIYEVSMSSEKEIQGFR